jgi:hypothetical protein
MANKHGGTRKNAGVKPKPYPKQRQPIHLTVYAENEKIEKHTKEVLKDRAKVAAQREIDRIK